MKTILALLIIALISVSTQDIEEDFVEQIYQEPQIIQQKPKVQEIIQEKLQTISQTQQRRNYDQGPFFTVEKLKNYRYQLVGIAGIIFYLICYFKGKRANAELIDAFYQQTQNYFNDNFAHVGFTKQNNDEPFIGQSANQVLYYASGRNNVQCMEINFNMRKRQDLISLLIYELIWPEKDTITIDIPVKTDIPLVFLLSLKKKMKSYIQKHLDVRMLTGSFQLKALHQNYQILGESADTIDQIFDGYTVKRISQTNGLFMYVHYTDQKMFSSGTGHLRVILNGAYKDKAKYLTAMQVIFHIADKIATLKLSANTKAKSIEARKIFNASKQKQALQAHRQQLRKQKQQKLRKQQAWIKSLPAEKQKKQDQKRKRKQMNKMMKGKTMKVM